MSVVIVNFYFSVLCRKCEIFVFLIFFFSSRRRHTRWPRDWSSDVCSSDLPPGDHIHRYFFAVHALNVEKMDIPPQTLPGAAGCMVMFNTIARALLVPTAQR